MTKITRVKLGLVVVGLALFVVGVRLDDARWRYAGIAVVFIAWALRFFRQPGPTPE